MTIENIIDKVKNVPNCKVLPHTGLPIVNSEDALPSDLREFYNICGGLEFFIDTDYKINIVPPEKFALANPVIVGDLCEGDISSKWYIIADDGNGDYLTIDMSEERRGRCYDSFHETHGVVGECKVVAMSFSELLERLLENNGKYWYWLDKDFDLGDAYDIVN